MQSCDTIAEIIKERTLQLSRIMSTRTLFCILILGSLVLTSSVAQAQAPLPASWPKQIELGMADAPGGAAALKSTPAFKFRYQYLAGGANTGGGWAPCHPTAAFAEFSLHYYTA